MSSRPAKLIVAASENNSDLLWATGFFVPDPCIFIQKGGRKYLVLSDLEYARAKKEARVHEVISHDELTKGRKKQRTGHIDLIALALQRLGIRHVEVPADFSLRLADGLRKKRIRVTTGADPFYPERAIKTATEVKAIGQAIRATERAERLIRANVNPALIFETAMLNYLDCASPVSVSVETQA